MTPTPAGARCLNCDAPLYGRFCAACGQRVRDRNPSLREFVDEIVGELFHWDGKFPATLKALMLYPGKLTEEVLAGRRARWLLPVRLYVICSLAYFVSGPLLERITSHQANAIARLQVTGDSATREELRILSDSATFVNDPDIRSNPLAAVIGTGRMWTLVTHPRMLQDIIAEAIPKAMFVLLPIFALMTMLAWRPAGLRFPAHLTFALQLHSALFVALSATKFLEVFENLPVDLLAQLALIAYSTWYTIVALRRTFGGTTWQLTWRSAVLGILYLPLMLALVIGATYLELQTL